MTRPCCQSHFQLDLILELGAGSVTNKMTRTLINNTNHWLRPSSTLITIHLLDINSVAEQLWSENISIWWWSKLINKQSLHTAITLLCKLSACHPTLLTSRQCQARYLKLLLLLNLAVAEELKNIFSIILAGDKRLRRLINCFSAYKSNLQFRTANSARL